MQQRIHFLLEVSKLLGDNGIEHHHRLSTVGTGTYGAELELIARKGKRRGAISIGCIDEKIRNFVDHIEGFLLRNFLIPTLN